MTACCGCGFHWGLAVRRKIQELSLYTDFAKNNSAKKLLEKVWALQFIPAERIRVVLTKFGTRSIQRAVRLHHNAVVPKIVTR